MTHIHKENRVIGWRCFHCDEYFNGTQRAEAVAHFGGTIDAQAACKVAQQDKGLVGFIREQERELEAYREEDTALHRRIASLTCQHAQDLRREEEKGYERGLRDGRTVAA